MTTKVGLYKDKRNRRRPWVVRWFGEYDPATGKERQYYESFTTKRQAETFRSAKQAELDRGGQRDRPEEITVGEFVERFMASKCKVKRVATKNAYTNTTKQLQAVFGAGTVLRRVSREAADRFIASRDRIAGQGEGFSEASRNQHLRNCKAMFRVAVEWGYLQNNPFAHVKATKAIPRKWHHLTPTEFQDLLAIAPDERWRAFYLFAYTTGARFGELFSFTWADIDFEQAMVVVRHRPGTDETPPFNVKDYETRTLRLPRQAIEGLLVWQAAAPEGVPYVLLTADRWQRVRERWQLCRKGTPWKRNKRTGELEWVEWENRYMVNNVLRTIASHVRRAGLTLTAPLTMHTFRKSFAQNHADRGTPIHVLQGLMGHSSITTTKKYYLQRSDANEKLAVKLYEELLGDTTAVSLLYQGEKKQPAENGLPVSPSSEAS